MNTPLMPLGYVDESTKDGGTFSMARRSDQDIIKPGTPVLIRNEHPDYDASAWIRGEVTEVTGLTATFMVLEQKLTPTWPKHIDPKGANNPVYLAHRGTFAEDYGRGFATQEELQFMLNMARQHEQETTIPPMAQVYVPAVQIVIEAGMYEDNDDDDDDRI